MPTTVNLSVGSGETKNLTFNCGGTFVPDDIQFVITGSGGDTNTDYVIICDTAAGTRLKEGTSTTSYTPTKGIHLIHIKNANSNTNGLYGKFNGVPSSTTSLIYINGSVSSSSNRTLPAGLYAAYYDGSTWHFRTDGRIDFGSTGFLKANGTVDRNSYLTAVSAVSAAPAASLSGTTLTFKQLSQTTAAQVTWTDSTTTLTFNTAPSSSNHIATMTDVNNAFTVNDAMVYKGTLGTGGTVTALPTTHKQGWTYKVITAGSWAGVQCEVGDMIICITDGTSNNNADWTVVQSNIDGAVIGPSSSTTSHIATFDGTTGKLIKDSGYTIGTSVPSNAVFTDEKVTPVTLATTGATNYNILLANNSSTPTTNGKPNYATTAKINGKGEITASKIIINSSSTNILLANGNTIAQSTFSTSGHGHDLTIVSGGTSTVNLSANTAYTLTAGGKTIVFKTPPDNNNNNVTTGKTGVVLGTTGVAVVQKDGTDSGTVSLPSTIPSTWLGNSSSTAAAGNHGHSGYLTSHQTIKVDGVTGATTSHYGTCSTAAGTATKSVSVTGTPTLEAGLRVIVKFTTTNSAANPTLKVGDTTAKTIYYRGSAITGLKNNILQANRVYEFVYDGTYWQLVGDIDTNTNNVTTGKTGVVLSTSGVAVVTKDGSDSGTVALPSNIPSTWLGNTASTAAAGNHTHGYSTVSGTNDGTNWTSLTINGTTKNIPSGGVSSSNSYSGIAYCNTAASTNEKAATYPNFVLQNGQRIILYMAVENSVSNGTGCTLNVNGTGAKRIKMETYNGSGTWGNVWGPTLSKGYYLCEYDNTNWKLTKINTSCSMGFCSSAAGSNKTVNIEGFALHSGAVILMGLYNDNTLSNAYLNVSGTGAFPIKVGNDGTTSSNFLSGLYMCDFDGTNWNVKQLISNSGGGSGVSYLSDLTDVQSSPITGNVLQYNGNIWTGGIAVTNVVAGSGLNVTSGDTTTDGGQIGYLDTSGNEETISSTGTIHLTRVNTSSSYNGTAKPGFGPSANKTVTSSNNTFYVPYYQVDKFGRVTGSATRTITINGLGGSGGGSSVSVSPGDSTNQGYIAGSIVVGNVPTTFVVPPARSVLGGSPEKYTAQGLVRPRVEYDFTVNGYSEGDVYELSSGTSMNSALENLMIFTDAPDPSNGKSVVLIPIVTIYAPNSINGKMEAVPFLALDYESAKTAGLLNGFSKAFQPKSK